MSTVSSNLLNVPASISSIPPEAQEDLILATTPSTVSLAGKWQSEWGVVEFDSNLTGRWNQGGGQIGQITSGSYDPKTRKLVFQYYQSWNNMDGTGTFTLSEDGNRLSGTWSQQPRGSNRLGSGGSGGWTMTRDKTSPQAIGTSPQKPTTCKANVSLAGEWQSDWGLVNFNSNLTGSWNQGGGQIGQIKDGSYDPKKCELVFHYYQSWNDMDGTTTLTLSEDGNRLAGSWIQQRRGSDRIGSGGSGGWIMTRKSSQEIAKADKEELLPEPGDIVIYKGTEGETKGQIIHSGVITAVRPDGTVTQVKSKWQAMGLYLHNPNESVYGNSWTVWRAKRKDGSSNNLLKKGRYRLYVGWYTDSAVKQDGTVDTNDLKDRVAVYSVLGGMPADSKFRQTVEEYLHSHENIQEVGSPNRNYNCHGFTFINGEESIDDKVVKKILHDNGYFQIRAQDTDRHPH
jgi:hypothetical protein